MDGSAVTVPRNDVPDGEKELRVVETGHPDQSAPSVPAGRRKRSAERDTDDDEVSGTVITEIGRNDVPKKLNARSKAILNDLWKRYGMNKPVPLVDSPGNGNGNKDKTAMNVGGPDVNNVSYKDKVVGFVDSTNQAELTETEKIVVRDAQKGKFSLFLSILKIIDDDGGPVPTKFLLRKLSLILRPADVPPIMDSKDIILAALHFLSSTYEVKSEEFLSLPLIVAPQMYSDMEKRIYQKATPWDLKSIKGKLMRMEDLFFRSPTSYKWLPRETLTPSTLFDQEERDFFMKGVLSETISARKNRSGEAAARKRRRQEAKARAEAAAAAAAAKTTNATSSATENTKANVPFPKGEPKDDGSSAEDTDYDDEIDSADNNEDDSDAVEATVVED